jgi:transposase
MRGRAPRGRPSLAHTPGGQPPSTHVPLTLPAYSAASWPLDRGRTETLGDFLQTNPLLAHGYDLKARFQTLLAQCDPAVLDQWLQDGETSDLPSFQSVARIFYQDDNAIKAALTTPWSMGQCEGQICRGKLLKRLGYGRAKLDVLRQRILPRVAVPVRPVKPRRQVNHHVAA